MRGLLYTLLSKRLRRLAADEGGAAAVEFALILPFLLLLYMGSIEASTLFTVDRRVEVISSTVADLVARWNPNQGTSIPKSILLDYFKASEGIIVPYPTTDLKQVVSFVRVSTAGIASVIWSCSYNGG
ncbi:MAG TPA: TadE/TadG family type IV pilus assembly protein, partial [Devosia sp.]